MKSIEQPFCLEGRPSEINGANFKAFTSVIVRFSVLSEIEDTVIEGGIRHEVAKPEV